MTRFNDLCALLGQPSPAGADPTGNESFCFQKRVVKDAELFALDDSGRVAEEPDADWEGMSSCGASGDLIV